MSNYEVASASAYEAVVPLSNEVCVDLRRAALEPLDTLSHGQQIEGCNAILVNTAEPRFQDYDRGAIFMRGQTLDNSDTLFIGLRKDGAVELEGISRTPTEIDHCEKHIYRCVVQIGSMEVTESHGTPQHMAPIPADKLIAANPQWWQDTLRNMSTSPGRTDKASARIARHLLGLLG